MIRFFAAVGWVVFTIATFWLFDWGMDASNGYDRRQGFMMGMLFMPLFGAMMYGLVQAFRFIERWTNDPYRMAARNTRRND